MRRAWWPALVLLVCVPAVALAGDIQVSCVAGLRVFLDGKLAGISNARDDGLFLASVPNGTHTVRVEKDGFAPQTFEVDVGKLPVEVKVLEFAPLPPGRTDREAGAMEPRRLAGSLLVTTAPQDCVVEIDGKPEVKNAPLLRVAGLAPGEHTISFSKEGYDRLYGVVSILPGAETTVRGDLRVGRLEPVYEGKGSLRVISTPEDCTVRIMGQTLEKTRTRLNVTYIPAGEQRLVVEWKGRKLTKDILIKNGQRAIVVVSFGKGEEPFQVSYEPE